MTKLTYNPRLSRYGYVLRRLAAGKTKAANYRMANALAERGLVQLIDEVGWTLRVEITDRGREAAKVSRVEAKR